MLVHKTGKRHVDKRHGGRHLAFVEEAFVDIV